MYENIRVPPPPLEVGDGGPGPGPSAISKSLKTFCLFFLFVFSPQPVFQKSNGLFQRKLITDQGSRGGPTFFPGGGVSNLFSRGGGGPIANSIKKPI